MVSKKLSQEVLEKAAAEGNGRRLLTSFQAMYQAIENLGAPGNRCAETLLEAFDLAQHVLRRVQAAPITMLDAVSF